MELGNPFEVVVYHLLIGGTISLGHWGKVLMVSALVCMVIYWTWPIVNYDIRLHQVATLYSLSTLREY